MLHALAVNPVECSFKSDHWLNRFGQTDIHPDNRTEVQTDGQIDGRTSGGRTGGQTAHQYAFLPMLWETKL